MSIFWIVVRQLDVARTNGAPWLCLSLPKTGPYNEQQNNRAKRCNDYLADQSAKGQEPGK